MAAITYTPIAGTKPIPPSSRVSANSPCTPSIHVPSFTRHAYGPLGMPCEPPTPILPLPRLPCALISSAKPLTEPEKRTIRIGIESEFELAPRYEDGERAMLSDFVTALANNHNKLVPGRHPRMQNFIKKQSDSSQYVKWCMVEEPTISVAGRPCPPCK